MQAPTNSAEPFPANHHQQQQQNGTLNRPHDSSSLSNNNHGLAGAFETSNPPEGAIPATSDIASSVAEAKVPAQAHNHRDAAPQPSPNLPVSEKTDSASIAAAQATDKPGTAPFPNGYHFPPKHSATQSTKLGLIAFWKYFKTPIGFGTTVYMLNVIAWGGMLFLLLCNASPAMCHPTCNHINSPRRKWIEWDSQILNALFCVTGFGLAPWRFRDLYFLMQYRVLHKEEGLRRLAGINRGWFRLPGSTELPIDLGPNNIATAPNRPSALSAIPHPEKKMPDAPLTGTRAPPTKVWKLDAVIWLMVWNTFFQVCLCVFMWGFDRYERPNWSTGMFIALAFGVGGAAGIVMFLEGKKVKAVEGVPISDEDAERLRRDAEQGVWHYNNIKDKELKDKKAKKSKSKSNIDR
jgi:hypothetical protein